MLLEPVPALLVVLLLALRVPVAPLLRPKCLPVLVLVEPLVLVPEVLKARVRVLVPSPDLSLVRVLPVQVLLVLVLVQGRSGSRRWPERAQVRHSAQKRRVRVRAQVLERLAQDRVRVPERLAQVPGLREPQAPPEQVQVLLPRVLVQALELPVPDLLAWERLVPDLPVLDLLVSVLLVPLAQLELGQPATPRRVSAKPVSWGPSPRSPSRQRPRPPRTGAERYW